MPVTFAAVRKFALSLDNVEEAPSYGTPGFRVGGVLFLRFHQDAESLVVRTDFDQREELLAADPASYYITSTTNGFSFACPAFTATRSTICSAGRTNPPRQKNAKRHAASAAPARCPPVTGSHPPRAIAPRPLPA
jgi:hypothetical protein